MKLSIRLTAAAIAAVALTGAAGAQQRGGGGHSGGSRASGHSQSAGGSRSPGYSQQARGSRSPGYAQQARAQAPRSFARQDIRVQRYAAPRADVRGRNDLQGRNDFGRNDLAGRNDVRGHVDVRAHVDVRGRDGYRPVAVADHGRPLITRGGFVGSRGYGRPGYGRPGYGGAHFGAGFNRWGGRLALPIGWGGRVVFGGFFPADYVNYCEAVPDDYDYLLPPMAPSYDPCLFGDRVVVYDRFSRSIVFIAAL
jgi:hypothetical protein